MPIDPDDREALTNAAAALRGFIRSLDVASSTLGPLADAMEKHGHLIPLSSELRTPDRLRALLVEMLSLGDDLRRIVEEIEAG